MLFPLHLLQMLTFKLPSCHFSSGPLWGLSLGCDKACHAPRSDSALGGAQECALPNSAQVISGLLSRGLGGTQTCVPVPILFSIAMSEPHAYNGGNRVNNIIQARENTGQNAWPRANAQERRHALLPGATGSVASTILGSTETCWPKASSYL